jgi:hypothetical protein
MYHAIVKRIAKKNFERIKQKDFESLAMIALRTSITALEGSTL